MRAIDRLLDEAVSRAGASKGYCFIRYIQGIWDDEYVVLREAHDNPGTMAAVPRAPDEITENDYPVVVVPVSQAADASASLGRRFALKPVDSVPELASAKWVALASIDHLSGIISGRQLTDSDFAPADR